MTQRDAVDTRHAHPAAGRCTPCQKQLYRTRVDARYHARRVKGSGHMSVYECPEQPGYWHYGRLPKAVLHGSRDRAAYEASTRASKVMVSAAFVGAPVTVTINDPRDAALLVDALDAACAALETTGQPKLSERFGKLRDKFADAIDRAAVPPCNDGVGA